MRKLIVFGFICLNCWAAHTQLASKIDSLEQLLEASSDRDTTRIQLLLDVANAYRGVSLDTSYLYAKKAYDLASASDHEYGMASADKIRGTYFLYSGITDSCIFYYQRSQDLFQKLGDLDGVHDINYNLGLLHVSLAEYDKAITYYQKDFDYRNQIKDTLGIADGYLNMGAVFLYKGDNQNAYSSFTASLPYFTQAGDSLSVAKVNFNLGTIQWNYSNYDLALTDFFSALEIFEQEGDRYLLASCLENIAGVYENMENYKNALKYYRASLENSTEVGNARLTASNYHSLGVAMDKSSQRDSALYYFDKSLGLSEEGDFKDLVSLNYHSLGVLYADADPVKGAEFLNKSISLKKSIELDDHNIALSLFELGTLHANGQQWAAAKKAFEQGWEISRQTDSKDIKSKLSYALYDLHKKMGNKNRALSYLEEFYVLKDSIFDEETSKNIVAREIQYETAKKDQQIQLLVKQKELQQAEVATKEALIKQRSVQRNLLMWGIVSLIIISLLLFRNYTIKLKSRELVNRKQQEFVNFRSRFFANVSHEFRTPLTLILGPLNDLLSSNPENREHQQSYQLMKQNGEKLLDLVNQLLDLAKLEAGNMPLRLTEADLKTFLRSRAAAFSSLADFQDISFHINVAPEITSGWFDSDALEKIINNLLSNAFKYIGEGGKIDFSASLTDGNGTISGEGTFLKIAVKDDGLGISGPEQEKIFDRFYQVKGPPTQEKTGTGIGLALTKELVELHKGHIAVASEEDKGTTFTVILPIARERFKEENIVLEDQHPQNVQDLRSILPSMAASDFKVPKVKTKGLPILLIIEDNADVRMYIRKQLQDTYEIEEANNGVDGFDLAQKKIPDIIISDVMMPGMSGTTLCEKLKQDEKTSHIPVILLTALASQASKLKGIETGADDYIVKPFDKKELRARVKNLIDQRQLLREKYTRQLRLEPKALAVTSTDERFLKKVMHTLEQRLDDSSFGVEDLAREVGMGRTQLFRKMRALTDQTVQDFVRDYRLKRAAQLLRDKAGNVSEVAYQVGFNNLSYFTKRFKELFGKTPSQYAS
ncbi:response regulator [Ulvibacterium sp.]|uniref:response regulator n=1 Tax=Ulvibacterium sp. TaxID=2665914 RepID=UPI0026070647|nr:response regulator [Ulvibacterium sp.]